MKYLEAKQLQQASANKMLAGHENKAGAASTEQRSMPKLRPEVRALADELGVDVTHINGTGPKGSITALDVRTAAIAGPTSAVVSMPVSAGDVAS